MKKENNTCPHCGAPKDWQKALEGAGKAHIQIMMNRNYDAGWNDALARMDEIPRRLPSSPNETPQ